MKGWAPTLVHLQIGVGGPPTLVYLEVGPNPCPFGSRPQVVKGCGAPNPCPFASREGLGGATLVHLQVVKGWGTLVYLEAARKS